MKWCCLLWWLLLSTCSPARADDLPRLETDVAALKDNLRRARQAWDSAKPFTAALLMKDAIEMQQAIDPQVAVLVTINPESRVKVTRGPAALQLNIGWQNPVLVKVINEAGVTTALEAKLQGPATLRSRFMEVPALFPEQVAGTRQLSGGTVEYRVLLFQSDVSGKVEVSLTLEAGQGTQDLGMRASLPLLVDTTIGQQPCYPDKSKLLELRDSAGGTSTMTSLAEWEKKRLQILERVQRVMGPLPAGVRDAVPVIEVDGETQRDNIMFRLIRYRTIDGDWVPAWLLLPVKRVGKVAAVLCLHQTTNIGKGEPAGQGGLPNLHYALELAQRGYITLSPDYPTFGHYSDCNAYQLGYVSTTMKGIVNHMQAVTLLGSLPEVDRDRIGCIGHSLGGHNTLFLGLFDTRVQAMATSCGFCSFAKYYHGDLTGWSSSRYMPRIASMYERKPTLMPFEFHEVLGALAPRAVFINAPTRDGNFQVAGVHDCVRSAKLVYDLYAKPQNLVVEHPDCLHDFPSDVRERCFRFLDTTLRPTGVGKPAVRQPK